MQYSFGHSRVSLQCQLILVVAVIKCITASGHDSPVRSETCTNLLQRKNATSSTAAPLLISLHSVTSERACWLFWDCQALKKKKHACRRAIHISLLSKWQNVLESLEGSSNNRRQHPPLLHVGRVQTFPFSLHLSKHVALFSGIVSRGLPAFFRTPGNQPSEVFLHPQNVKLTFPQSDFFDSRGIHVLNS